MLRFFAENRREKQWARILLAGDSWIWKFNDNLMTQGDFQTVSLENLSLCLRIETGVGSHSWLQEKNKIDLTAVAFDL